MKLNLFVIGLIIIIISALCMGWLSNDLYRDWNNKRILNGVRFESNDKDRVEAIQTAKTFDNMGDWVCINVKGMDFELARDTCNHEVAHEIFAEYCDESDDNFDKCMGVTKK